jgi:phosphatidate cytidylyltransferase
MALRVVSSAVLIPVGLLAVLFGGIVVTLAAGAFALIAAFEWGRMASPVIPGRARALHLVLAVTAIGAVILAPRGLELAALAALSGMAVAYAIAQPAGEKAPIIAFGAAYVSFPFAAFVWLREVHPDGQFVLYAVFALIWISDIAAFFTGRGFGGPRLSPKDSPNKTWSGAIGAVVAASLSGGAIGQFSGGETLMWIVAGAAVSAFGQAGDLLESRFKRGFGVKDASGFIPGHGGVLDRLDSLMAAIVACAVLARFQPCVILQLYGRCAP